MITANLLLLRFASGVWRAIAAPHRSRVERTSLPTNREEEHTHALPPGNVATAGKNGKKYGQ
jgi:hypothetical protein